MLLMRMLIDELAVVAGRLTSARPAWRNLVGFFGRLAALRPPAALPGTSGTALRCPHGHDGPFRHLEDAPVYRDVREIDGAARRIIVAAQGRIYEEEGCNARLQCHADAGGAGDKGEKGDAGAADGGPRECLAEFPIPPGFQIDFR